MRLAGVVAKAGGLYLTVAMGAVSVPRIASIDYYGLRKIPEQRIQRVLGLKVGDLFPPSKGEVEERLEKVSGVVLARLEAVCCEQGKGILFVGIEEKGATHFNYRTPPIGAVALPDDMMATYRELVQAVELAARRGSTAEDLTHGHPLMADPDARDIQERFIIFGTAQASKLRDVLHNSQDESHRAIAATILGYSPDKTTVVEDLESAMQDPAQSVRASAMRALKAIAVLARLQPDLHIRIHPTWFVEMLNSVVLSDRTRALDALIILTDSHDASTLQQLQDRALSSLVEMAQWRSLPHALPAFILLGRTGGLSDDKIQTQWTNGERGAMVLQILRAKKSAAKSQN